jgi:hypothetical protein
MRPAVRKNLENAGVAKSATPSERVSRTGKKGEGATRTRRARSPSRKTEAQEITKERERLRGEIWGRLQLLFDGIRRLPPPDDVIEIVSSAQQSVRHKIDEQIGRTASWLTEFEREWAPGQERPVQHLRAGYLDTLRNADKRQRITEILALISALDLTLADLDTKTLKDAQKDTAPPTGDPGGIPDFLRREPAPADADAAKHHHAVG